MDLNEICVSGLALGLYLGSMVGVVSLIMNTFIAVALDRA